VARMVVVVVDRLVTTGFINRLSFGRGKMMRKINLLKEIIT